MYFLKKRKAFILFSVYVGFLPRASCLCTAVSGAVGEDKQLNCTKPSTSDAPYCAWYLNRDEVYFTGHIIAKYQSRFSVVNYDLHIKDIATSDSGQYKCVDDGGDGAVLSCFDLIVTGRTILQLNKFYA